MVLSAKLTAQLVTDALIMAIWRRGKVYRTRDAARADVFDCVERFLQCRPPALDHWLPQPG